MSQHLAPMTGPARPRGDAPARPFPLHPDPLIAMGRALAAAQASWAEHLIAAAQRRTTRVPAPTTEE